jgi:hypothetical protein
VITVTTVGYREVHDLSRPARHSAIDLIVGAGAALVPALLAAVVVEGGLPKRFQRRPAARMLENQDHLSSAGKPHQQTHRGQFRRQTFRM